MKLDPKSLVAVLVLVAAPGVAASPSEPLYQLGFDDVGWRAITSTLTRMLGLVEVIPRSSLPDCYVTIHQPEMTFDELAAALSTKYGIDLRPENGEPKYLVLPSDASRLCSDWVAE